MIGIFDILLIIDHFSESWDDNLRKESRHEEYSRLLLDEEHLPLSRWRYRRRGSGRPSRSRSPIHRSTPSHRTHRRPLLRSLLAHPQGHPEDAEILARMTHAHNCTFPIPCITPRIALRSNEWQSEPNPRRAPNVWSSPVFFRKWKIEFRIQNFEFRGRRTETGK